jgi:hypothetical protein
MAALCKFHCAELYIGASTQPNLRDFGAGRPHGVLLVSGLSRYVAQNASTGRPVVSRNHKKSPAILSGAECLREDSPSGWMALTTTGHFTPKVSHLAAPADLIGPLIIQDGFLRSGRRAHPYRARFLSRMNSGEHCSLERFILLLSSGSPDLFTS